MSADTRKKIYDILKNKTGFMDSYEDFDNDMTTSEDARKKVYEVLREKTGFNDTYENFVSGISGEVQRESAIPPAKEESGNVVTTVQSPSYPQRAETKERILNNIPDYFQSKGTNLSTLPLPQNTMSAEKPADIPGRIVQDEQQRIQLAERAANDPYMKQQELEHVFKPKNQEQIDSVRQLINSARQQRVKERQQRVKSAGGGGIFSTMSQAYLAGEQNDADKQLEYASTLIEQAQNITNKAKKKGNTNFFSGFARGFKDAPLDGWAMGLQDLKNYSAAKKVMDKVDRGEELSPSEDALMQALVTNAATQMYYSGDLGRGYKAGGVTAESLPFMLDMIAGMGTIQAVTKPASKALVKYATEKAAKMGLGRATTGLAKGASRTAAGLGDVAAHTATFGGARVAADYQRRGLGDVQVSPEHDGTVSYAGRGNVQTGAEAIGKSIVSTAAETGSELLGEYFAPMLGWVGKVTGANRLGKIIPASVGKAYSSIINSNGFKQVQEIARRAKIADPIGEYGEEVVNNLVSTAIGDMTPEQLVDLDNNIDTFLGVAPMSALFGAAGTGKYVVNKFSNYRNMKRFEEEMRETMGEDWSGVREALQDADIETAREMVKDVLRSGMQSDMKQKAIKYIATVLQEQTLQQVDMQMAPEQIINEKKSIFKNLSDARKKINLTDEQLEEALDSSGLSMYDEQTERSIEEYRQAYNDYLNYTYWVHDQAYVARREAESQVERMTNATTGTVMRVKSGLSQNPVNILRGNIVFDAEGNVDKDSSDNTIYYLSEDGKVKMAPISMFESLVDDTPAEELAYQAGEDAEQEFIQNEEAQLMQPEQSVQPIELETTFQSDGVTYSVTQKSPDGYVVSALDEEGNPVQSKLLTEEQIRTAMTPAIQEEQTSQEQVVQNEDVTQPEQQQAQTEPQTAISRIPVNENGEHDFESAPYQDTSSALIEISENVDDAKDTAAQMINHYQEELKKADKAKTTGNTIQEIVRLKQQKKANIQSINDKIAYWNSVANDIESKRPGGIIEQAKEESDANQQRLSGMTAEQQQAAQEEVQKKIDSGAYERKEPRKRARYVNEDNEMGTANTPMEHVLREIATGRVTFNWNDSGETQGLGSHLGLASSPEERRRMIWALSSDGMTPEAAAEQIHADMPENLQGMVTDQDVFNMILDAFHQNGTPSKMWESAKSMHGTDVEESAPGYEDYMEQQALEWEASQNNMTVEEWISYVDYVEEELDNMYSSVSDEDLNAIFERFNEQIISENESRGNETESAGSTEGQTDGEQGDELLPEGRGNNEGTDTTVNEQPDPANQADGESGGVVPEPGSEVTREKETYDGALNNGNDSVSSQNNLNGREHEQGEVAGVSGESGSLDGKNEAEAYLRRAGDRTTAEDGQSRWTRNTLLRDVVQRNKGHQTWIDDIQSIISGERIGLGGENDVYLSRDGKSVVKINDFSYLPENSTNFDSFMNRVDAHNELFPHDAITILGFTLNSDGKVSVVLSQPYISNAREATQEEIDNFLEEMGFYTDMSGNWTDGTYEIADTKPNNVLVDEDGNLHFIDVLPYDSRKPGKMLEIPAKRNAFVAPDIKKGEDVLDYIHRVAKAKEIHDAERETDTNPTEAQKEAGNYKKGHVKVDGFDITIENPKGSVRSGKDADGKEWSVTMKNDYGYIRGTEGVDGDHIDVFLSDNPEQGNVYVIDQVNQKTGEYDESKVMYGFNSLEEAKDAYLANFEEGWKVGVVSGVSKEEFRKWIESSVRKTKPFSEYKSVKVEEAQNEGIRPDEGVLDYAKRVAEREQKKAKPAKKIDVFSYTDAKSNISAYRGAYYSDGTVTATNGFILIRLQATYPRENEGKVIDKKGEEVANVRYPKVELIIPKGEQETVTVDKESVRAKLNEIETKLKEEWVKSDKKTPYKTLKAITTIKVNIGGVTHNMSIERLTALLDGMDAIGTNQVGITKSIAYAKNGKQLIAVAFNAKDIDDIYDSLSISDETYSEDTINQMKRVGVPLTDLEGIPQSDDGMFQVYGIQDVVGETVYFVSSPGKTVKNMDENYVGTGDRMFRSLDEAIKGAEEERASYQRTKADSEEREERVRQRIEEERKAQETKDATPIGKFLKTLNRLQAGKADAILSDNVSFNGETMSKSDFIQRVIADGYAAEEYLDGTKVKYRLVKDGKGYKINKTEFDFAKFAGAETIEVENKDDLINLERLSRKYADKGVYTMTDIDKRIASAERRLKGTNENGKEGQELKKALEELKELKRLKEMQNSGELRFREDDDIRFREDDKNLIAVHNLSEESLQKAFELGGFPMPSIAVTSKELGHTEFGDISLVFDKETINPTNRQNRVYAGDAWTPVFPEINIKISEKVADDIREKIADLLNEYEYAKDFGLHIDNTNLQDKINRSGSFREAYKDNMALKVAFLKHKNINFKPVLVEKRFSSKVDNATLKEIVKATGKEASVLMNLAYDETMQLEPVVRPVVSAYREKEMEKLMESLSPEKRESSRAVAFLKRDVNKELDYSDLNNLFYSAFRYEREGDKKIADSGKTREKLDSKFTKKLQQEFESWLDELSDGIIEKRGIRNERDMFTPSGNRRSWEALYDDITLDNVVNAMRAQSEKGGEGVFGGSIFGAAQKDITSIEELKEIARQRLSEIDSDEYQAEKDEITNRLSNLPIPGVGSSFGSTLDMIENITDAVRTSHTASGIYKYLKKYYPKITKDVADEIAGIVKDIQKMNTKYFEAKPYRAVGFDEVKLAVVPRGTSQEVIDKLESLGIPVKTYKKGDDAARKRILNTAAKKSDLLFRFIGEQGAANLDRAEEATIRLDNLNVAREMESEGKDTKSIKMATGWERGADGKWRYETEESKLKDGWEKLADRTQGAFLKDVIDDKELFEAYPQLEMVRVQRMDPIGDIQGGYDPVRRELYISNRISDVHSVFAHEIQHMVQYAEEFSQGGDGTETKQAVKDINTKISNIVNSQEYKDAMAKFEEEYAPKINERINEEYSDLDSDRKDSLKSMMMNDEYEMYKYNVPILSKLANLQSELYALQNGTIKSSGYVYRHLSGEVEARNVQSRIEMTPEERRNTLASETEDVAREDQIFLYDSMGANSMVIDADQIAENLNVPVQVINSIDDVPEGAAKEAIQKGRKLKGWYDVKTGKVYVYLPNATSAEDVKQTILHEGIAHFGLRQLVGEERMDDFLDEVFSNVSSEVRRKITDSLPKYGYNSRVATEEYMASIAENGVDVSTWEIIKQAFKNLLRRMGINISINDNELKYILWRSAQNLDKNRPIDLAIDVAMQYNMGVGNYFREGESDGSREEYENSLKGWKYKAREAYQDSMLALKNLQEVIANVSGKPIKSFEDAYTFENQLSSKNTSESEKYYDEFFVPLLNAEGKLIKKYGLTHKAIERYMMLAHGIERNVEMTFREQLNEIIKENPDDAQHFIQDFKDEKEKLRAKYSGYEYLKELSDYMGEVGDFSATEKILKSMDNEEHADFQADALDYVKDFESMYDVKELWEKTNKATKETLKKSFESGMMDKDHYNNVRNMFMYYVPLRGWTEDTAEDVYEYINSERSPVNSVLKEMKGRINPPDEVIATIGNMAESAIMQGNRNMMKQAFMNMVVNHPTDVATLRKAWYVYNPVEDEWSISMPEIEENDTPETIAEKIKNHDDKMKQLKEQGLATQKSKGLNIDYRIMKNNISQHAIIVKNGGKDFVIYVNGNPRAAQAVNGLTNPDAEKNPIVIAINNANRWLAANFTTRNPAFVASNFLRDVIFSNSAIWVKEDAKYSARFRKNIFRAFPSVYRGIFGKRNNSEADKYFREFVDNGGETGYMHLHDVDAYKKKVRKELARITGERGSAKRAMDYTLERLEDFNRMAEDISRFAVYMTSRQMGRSIVESVRDAKEVTVNFNKKGSGYKTGGFFGITAGTMRWFYLFLNASIQSLTNFNRLRVKNPVKFYSTLGGFMTAGLIIPVINTMLYNLFGDGDDNPYNDLPEWVRRNNLCIYAGGKRFLTVPLPIELRAFYGLGDYAFQLLTGREKPSPSGIFNGTVSQVADILPLNPAGSEGVKALIPDVVSPFVETYYFNETFTGKPIRKETPFNERDPEWKRGYKGTAGWLVDASKFFNDLTNGGGPGSDFRKGWIDINPANVENILESYFGGMATFLNQSGKTIYYGAKSIIEGEKDDNFTARNIPIINRLYNEVDDRNAFSGINTEYFNLRDEMEQFKYELNGVKKNYRNNPEEYRQIVNSDMFRKYMRYKPYQDRLDRLYKMAKELEGQDRKQVEDMIVEIRRELVNSLK